MVICTIAYYCRSSTVLFASCTVNPSQFPIKCQASRWVVPTSNVHLFSFLDCSTCARSRFALLSSLFHNIMIPMVSVGRNYVTRESLSVKSEDASRALGPTDVMGITASYRALNTVLSLAKLRHRPKYNTWTK
jgi:hypothetical protein